MKFMLKACLSLICLLIFCVSSSALALEDNLVEISNQFDDLTNVRFIELEHDITEGQSYAGTTAKFDGSKILINVRADRQKSEETARSFADAVGSGDTLVCYAGGNLPEQLNFWVRGDLEIEENGEIYTCPDVILAQGNMDLTNNWWVAGPHFTNVTTLPLVGPLLEICLGDTGGIIPKVAVLGVFPTIEGGAPVSCVNTFDQLVVSRPTEN